LVGAVAPREAWLLSARAGCAAVLKSAFVAASQSPRVNLQTDEPRYANVSFARLVPELYCSNLERSLSFYVDVLGFAVRYARPEECFAYLDKEGAELMIEQPTGRAFVAGTLEHPYGRGVNFQIQVSHVEPLYAAVCAAGAPVFLSLEDRWYRQTNVELGNRQFIVQDPDGYLLRFFEDRGSRPIAGEALEQ
jgi:catechol 2,3-dioxygenase-like lactoylglutathione lyase family enzyme